jgi:hypothetical protein
MPFVRCSVSPALPAGLALNALSGSISGTPTTVSALATYTGERIDYPGRLALGHVCCAWRLLCGWCSSSALRFLRHVL